MSNLNNDSPRPSAPSSDNGRSTAPGYKMLPQQSTQRTANQDAIVSQPKQGEIPQTNHLRGLQLLAVYDKLHIKQKVDAIEFFGFETENRYVIKNASGETVFWAYEKSDALERACCEERRSFEMNVVDVKNNPVLKLYRPYATECCCSEQDLHMAEIAAPPSCPVGTVQQAAFFSTEFDVKQGGRNILKIQGPGVGFTAGSADFNFVDLGGRRIGGITKKWSGFFKEMGTNADNFELTFPMDLDVRVKAILLGAVFFIDSKYYERR